MKAWEHISHILCSLEGEGINQTPCIISQKGIFIAKLTVSELAEQLPPCQYML